MKAKLIVEGKEFPIEIQDPELQKLLAPTKKTGYERVSVGERFYSVRADTSIFSPVESCLVEHNTYYNTANYYSSEDLAENNARADKLMRQLRRFAVEHRENELDWSKRATSKWFIEYDYQERGLYAAYHCSCRHFGGIYFDSAVICDAAIEEFKDELVWLFTEYRDSL